MIIFHRPRPESLAERLRRKDWEKSLREITDAEIISINPNPLDNQKELPEKVENNGTE